MVGSFTQSPINRLNLRTKMDARNLVTVTERDDPIYTPMKEILKEKKPKVIGPKQPKEYICQICDKKYSCRSSLWQHKKTHTGERKYKERVFKRFSELLGFKNCGVQTVGPNNYRNEIWPSVDAKLPSVTPIRCYWTFDGHAYL